MFFVPAHVNICPIPILQTKVGAQHNKHIAFTKLCRHEKKQNIWPSHSSAQGFRENYLLLILKVFKFPQNTL